jgi:hypothetical protein
MYELVSAISNVSKYYVNINNSSKEDDAIIDKLSLEDSPISDPRKDPNRNSNWK